VAERLETRALLSGPDPTVGGANGFTSFAGVGFRLVPVGTILGTRNGVPDGNPSSYSATIDWGDGKTTDGTLVRATNSNRVIIKGTHTYADAKDVYQISVTVRGPDGDPVTQPTTMTHVILMPDARAQPGQEPPAADGVQEPTDAEVTVHDVNPFTSYAGVGFALNPVGRISGTLNLKPDHDPDHYKAYVNWGDSPAWHEAKIAPEGDGTGVIVKGSYIYAQPGLYPVSVYAVGADGQTHSFETTTANVVPMPLVRPSSVQIPGRYDMGREPTDVALSMSDVNPISAVAGVALSSQQIARARGTINGFPHSSPGSYKVQVNWGDGPTWTDGQVLLSNETSNPLAIRGTHTYQEPGIYKVVVNLTGPDGQTFTDETATVIVRPATVSPLQITGLTLNQQALNPTDSARCVGGTLSVRGGANERLRGAVLEVIQNGQVLAQGGLTAEGASQLLGRPLGSAGITARGHLFRLTAAELADVDGRFGRTVTFRVRLTSDLGREVQRTTSASSLLVGRAGEFLVDAGQYTFDVEGFEVASNRSVFSRRLHWPGGLSGVTIGRGYDLGSRTRAMVLADLQAAGFSDNQARLIAAGAGLTGTAARDFVTRNRNAVGDISPEAQQGLFQRIYPGYVSGARNGYNRATVDSRGRPLAGRVAWERLNPVIRTMLTDLWYQGFRGSNGMRAAMRNRIGDLIRYIEGRPDILSHENGRNRLGYLRHALDGGCGPAPV
jgi:hypothetical protein